MKLIFPGPQVGEADGFSDTLDLFSRKAFGEKLADVVEGCCDGAVLALDAPWGEGKTTFVRMWRGFISHHREPPLAHIYFDAFSNDYQRDPFLTLASEL